jgi:hypothetical protein
MSWKHKNNKVFYYARNFARQIYPEKIFRLQLDKKLSSVKDHDRVYLGSRVNYYNRLKGKECRPSDLRSLDELKLKKKNKTYFFDSYEYIRFFNPNLRADFLFGDVTYVPEIPSLLKSRPVGNNNSNSVLLNLDKIRHSTFVDDTRDFRNKKDMLVSRNHVSQPHRIKFLELYNDDKMCNIGMINKSEGYEKFLKEWLTFEEQLRYKFILCLEGNDVASNLKWVMSSQSLAVMPAPKYETWFMEGTLIADYHYVLIRDDYTDLRERMEYYIKHPDEAKQIINNAHMYIEQFRNKKREDLISLLVLEKYFYMTGQKELDDNLKAILPAVI